MSFITIILQTLHLLFQKKAYRTLLQEKGWDSVLHSRLSITGYCPYPSGAAQLSTLRHAKHIHDWGLCLEIQGITQNQLEAAVAGPAAEEAPVLPFHSSAQSSRGMQNSRDSSEQLMLFRCCARAQLRVQTGASSAPRTKMGQRVSPALNESEPNSGAAWFV